MFEIIKALCEENNLSITTVCKEITGSSGNLSTWKRGNIRNDYLVKIAQYFNVSTDYLLGLTENPTPPKKQLTHDDRVRIEIAKLTPAKRKQAEEYIEFLKTREEFSHELKEQVENIGQRLQTD